MGNGWFYCYIMLEFQRKTDKLMVLRIAEYNTLLIRALHKAKLITLDGYVPPIIPIVIFMGEGNWTARTSVQECRPQFSPAMEEYQLQQKYILLQAKRITVGSQTSLAELLFAICDSKPDQVEHLAKKLETLLKGEEYDNLRQLFMEMINCAILQPAGIEPVDSTINFQEANEMFAARAKKWRQEVLNEGILIGMGMPEDKAKNWRQEIFGDMAKEMLKAGEPREKIIKYTRLTDAELDKLQ